jgi:type VI protein secretion system component Hcp
MSKTDDSSKFADRELTDIELDAVSGGEGEGRLHLGGTTGSANTQVNHSEFTIVKLLDAATPK